MSAKKKARGKACVLSESQDMWLAHGVDDPGAGFLLFNKITSTYHAGTNELRLFTAFATPKNVKPENSPSNKIGRLKSEFLLLPAMRGRFQEHMEGSRLVASSWRHLYLMIRRAELEEETGQKMSDQKLKKLAEVAWDPDAFQKYGMEIMAGWLQEDDAADRLIKLGKWLESFDQKEVATLDERQKGFLSAVEVAASAIGRVPTQKSVRETYNADVGVNLKLSKNSFEDLRDMLGFSWLPQDVRGPNKDS